MAHTPVKIRFAAVAVDVAVFAIIDGVLCALVDAVNRPPHYTNMEGFPGGLIKPDETAREAAFRILNDKVSIKSIYIEQLYTFSEVERDKRGRVVAVAYLGLIRPDQAVAYAHPTAHFVPVKKLSGLAYDHDDVLHVACGRLQGRLGYTTIAQYLLPKEFTLTQLQEAYEIITETSFDKRNFRKKILSLNIVKETGKVQKGVQNRPAALYRFTSAEVTMLPLIT